MSDTKRITLYAAVDSPFPHRVRLALEEAGAKYDIIWIDLIKKQEWYEKKVYPGGAKVPYLIYGGPELHPDESPAPETVKIQESLIINEFITDLFPSAELLPTDPALRAKARLFVQTVDSAFLPAFVGFAFLGAPAEGLYAVLEKLQGLLPPEGGFVVGKWSLADAAFAPLIMRLETILSMNVPTITPPGAAEKMLKTLRSERFARLQQWKRDIVARPSMAKTYDEPAVIQKTWERIERLQKTGKFNSELSIPIPQK